MDFRNRYEMRRGMLMKQIIGPEIAQQIKAYEKIFDLVRIVDPIQKKVIRYKDYEELSRYSNCYSLWQDNHECKDCIIIKALKSQKTFIKIQHNEDKVFLMFAMPLETNGETLALELMKDITEGLIFEMIFQGQGNEHELRNIVQDLNALIMKDSMTSLYNRRYIDRTLPEEIAGCSNRNPLSIAMMDIDRFKAINDTYGHNVGDLVIKKIASILTKSIRNDGDWVARYGGEEFLVCLPGTNNEKAYKAIERVRRTIEKTIIRAEDKRISVTASFGLYTIKHDELAAVDLLKYADEKLYQAKNQGRNKVIR